MIEELIRVRGIGQIAAERLINAGVKSIEEVANSNPEQLAWIKGIGMISAKKIIENANELINLEKGIQKVLNSIKENFAKSCPKMWWRYERKIDYIGTRKED